MSKCRKPIEYVKYWLRYDHLNKYMSYGNSVLYALAPSGFDALSENEEKIEKF